MADVNVEVGKVFTSSSGESVESSDMKRADDLCAPFPSADVCNANENCMWHNATGRCRPFSYAMEPSFVDNLKHVDPIRVKGALELAKSMSNFRTLIGDTPTPESIFLALQWQQMYEMKKKKTMMPAPHDSHKESVKLEFYNTQILYLRDRLSAIKDPESWVAANAWKFKNAVITPGWNGDIDAIPYTSEEKVAYPGDIVWGGGKLGLLGAAHCEIYIGMHPLDANLGTGPAVPWGVGLGEFKTSDLIPFDAQGRLVDDDDAWGSVHAGNIIDNFKLYGDGLTMDVLDIARNEDRMPRLTSVKLAVSCIGCWNYKMNNPHIWMVPFSPQRGASNCQQFAMYIQTGNFYSPGLDVARDRIFNMMGHDAIEFFKTYRKYGMGVFMSGTTRIRQREFESDAFQNAAKDQVISQSQKRGTWPVGNPEITDDRCSVFKSNAVCFGRLVVNRIETLRNVNMTIMLLRDMKDRLVNEYLPAFNMAFEKFKNIKSSGTADKKAAMAESRKMQRVVEVTKASIEAVSRENDGNHRMMASWGMAPDNVEENLEALRGIVDGRLPIDGVKNDALKNMLMVEKDRLVMVQCGVDGYCRDIHELRSILTRQNVRYAYDPHSLQDMSPKAVKDIMTAPPELRPRIAALERAAAAAPPRSLIGRIRSKFSPY
jgi:hypothetical protein